MLSILTRTPAIHQRLQTTQIKTSRRKIEKCGHIFIEIKLTNFLKATKIQLQNCIHLFSLNCVCVCVRIIRWAESDDSCIKIM